MATATQPLPPSTVPTPPTVPTPSPMSMSMPTPTLALTLYRMSYDLYERIAEHGLLGPKDRVVLLDGVLVNQMPRGPKHTTSVALGQVALQVAAPVGWYVRAEQPIVLRDGPQGDSAPQPDLALAIGSILRYADRHPIGPEIGLVVEVATDPDALRIDRAGLARYAHAGIPIACIVNIPDRSIEVYSEPSGPSADPGYRRLETLRPGQSLAGEIGNATTGPAAIAPIPVESFFAPE
jgi:Putative restriction endonuclease